MVIYVKEHNIITKYANSKFPEFIFIRKLEDFIIINFNFLYLNKIKTFIINKELFIIKVLYFIINLMIFMFTLFIKNNYQYLFVYFLIIFLTGYLTYL